MSKTPFFWLGGGAVSSLPCIASMPDLAQFAVCSYLPTEISPYNRETGVAIPLSHCVFCSIADYRYYIPTSFRKKMAYRDPKTGLGGGGGIAERLASEASFALYLTNLLFRARPPACDGAGTTPIPIK